MAQTGSTKKQAIALIQKLPPKSNWDDILHQLYVGKKIEAGIEAADAGRVIGHEDVKRRFRRER